jgi:hypothetical protein
MSADSTSDDEQPIVHEEAVSAVIQKPTRTSGDLSEGGEASGGITLEGLLRRVQRIEHLGISDPKKPEPFGRVTEPSPTVHIPRPTRPSLIEPKPDTHEESTRPEDCIRVCRPLVM